MHKAKGDQFECVIIPGLGRKLKADDHTLIARDGDILSLNNNKEEPDNLYNYHRSKELIRRQNENIRLLYVGITRAKQDCHLIGTVLENSKGELSPPKNSLLNGKTKMDADNYYIQGNNMRNIEELFREF